MKQRGVIVREKNSADRAQLQNNSILDSAIKKIQGFLQNRRAEGGTLDPACVPYVPAASLLADRLTGGSACLSVCLSVCVCLCGCLSVVVGVFVCLCLCVCWCRYWLWF